MAAPACSLKNSMDPCFLGKDINGFRFYFWDGIQNWEFLAFYIRPFLSSVCASIFQAKQHITNPNLECLRIPNSKSKLGMLKNSEFLALYIWPLLSLLFALPYFMLDDM